jgi:hypothetical protein
MISNNTTLLSDLKDIFIDSAYQSIESLFGKKCDHHTDWEIVDQLNGNFDLTVTLCSASNEFQSILAVGINADSLNAFVGESADAFETHDILGEFANVYCAVLADNTQFSSRFGILIQSIPILYSKGQQFLPFISGVQGRVNIDNNWMYIGYAIQKNNRRKPL